MTKLTDLNQSLSNEQVVLVLFARLYFNTATYTEVANYIAAHPIDWHLLYKMTRAHGLRPFVGYVINKYGVETDPAFACTLKNGLKTITLSNLKNMRMMVRMVNELKMLGIVAIPYKGTILAESYFESIGLREISDLDFLVSEDDVAKIEDYLIAKGGIAKETVPRPYLNFYQSFFKDIVYVIPKNEEHDQFTIEIHWRLMNRFTGEFPGHELFAKHLESCQMQNLKYDKLKPGYDLLATISNHFVKDMSTRFKYIVDVGCFFHTHPDLDDQVILSQAEKYGFMKRIQIGFSLVEELLGIQVNRKLILPELPKAYLVTSLQYPLSLRLRFGNPAFMKYTLQMQDTFWHKGRILWRFFVFLIAPTYQDINTFRLPAWCLPLLFVLRPFRLILRTIRRAR